MLLGGTNGVTNKKPPPGLPGAANLLGAVPWPFVCLASLRQFNGETFHAAGQRHGDASHGCSVVVSRRLHFGPTGDDLDCRGDKQSGNNDHGEYVTHGLVPSGSRCPSIPMVKG